MRFTVITPTSNRPEAFELCCQCMARQVFRGDAEWVIVDDSFPLYGDMNIQTPDNLDVKYVREKPSDEMTVSRNYLAGYAVARTETIVFFEDDEWYRSDYLEKIVSEVEKPGISIAGAPYYRVYVFWRKTAFEGLKEPLVQSALCKTAIRGSRVINEHTNLLKTVVRNKGAGSGDTVLWSRQPQSSKSFVVNPGLNVSFKGILGKVRLSSTGIHPREFTGWTSVEKPDPEGRRLIEWIGEEDARKYLDLAPEA